MLTPFFVNEQHSEAVFENSRSVEGALIARTGIALIWVSLSYIAREYTPHRSEHIGPKMGLYSSSSHVELQRSDYPWRCFPDHIRVVLSITRWILS